MATGIVSVAFSLDGIAVLGWLFLAFAAAACIVVVVLVAWRAPGRLRLRAPRGPAVLTAVASTDVLGTALVQRGASAAGAVLLAVGLSLWLVLLPVVLKTWQTPNSGVSFMVAVATESLAALAAALAASEHAPWLLDCACAALLVGGALYVVVLVCFDLRQLRVGSGDQWISSGALAISALAAGQVTLSAGRLGVLATATGALRVVSLVLWGLASAWLPALVFAEVVRPRLVYDLRRWSTVFPLAMYAACSLVVARAARAPVLADLGRVWVWIGVAAWLWVCAAMLAATCRPWRRSTG